MFKKENRLTKDRDFDNVFKNGYSVFNKFLGIKVLKNKINVNRFGILVSNKVSKKAVERNKIKRRIREILKKETANFADIYDYVIIALPTVLEISFQDLEKSIKFLLKKARLRKK